MDNLKDRLKEFYREQEADFDPDETKNVLETLEGLEDDLSDATKWEFVELMRLIDSNMKPELYKELDELEMDYLEKQEKKNENPFD